MFLNSHSVLSKFLPSSNQMTLGCPHYTPKDLEDEDKRFIMALPEYTDRAELKTESSTWL